MSYSKIIIVNGWVLALVLAGCQNKQKIDRPAAVEAYISAVEARQAGQDAEAIARLEAALAANPNLTMARRLLADLYRETGEYDRARQHYEVTSKIDFYEFENHYFLGLMYQFLDRLQEAAAAYVQALKLNPGDLKSNMNLGLVYLSLNDNPSAVQYLKRAVEINQQLLARTQTLVEECA